MREIDAGVGSQLLMVAQVVHVTPQDAVKIEAYRPLRLHGLCQPHRTTSPRE